MKNVKSGKNRDNGMLSNPIGFIMNMVSSGSNKPDTQDLICRVKPSEEIIIKPKPVIKTNTKVKENSSSKKYSERNIFKSESNNKSNNFNATQMSNITNSPIKQIKRSDYKS